MVTPPDDGDVADLISMPPDEAEFPAAEELSPELMVTDPPRETFEAPFVLPAEMTTGAPSELADAPARISTPPAAAESEEPEDSCTRPVLDPELPDPSVSWPLAPRPA
jgi:hypothetical protein